MQGLSGFEPELQLLTDDDSSSLLVELVEGRETGMNPGMVDVGNDVGGKDDNPEGWLEESSCILFRCLKNVCHMAAYDGVGGTDPAAAAAAPNPGGRGKPGWGGRGCREGPVGEDVAAAAAAAAAAALGGHWNVEPDKTISLISVSIGVFPTRRTKNSCSMTDEETVLRLGNLNKSLPNLVGWFGYWLLQYSSRAHWDFSCSCSIICVSLKPGASETGGGFSHL